MKNTRTRKAFTLLELVVAVVILAIISAVALPTFLSLITGNAASSAASSTKVAAGDAFANASGSGIGVTTANIYSAYSDGAASATSIPSTMTAGSGGVVKYTVTVNGTTYGNCETYSATPGIAPTFNGTC
jgi:prepilin-type N-terminal cleavage/methylation domain-containing protein